ncbi:MAG TPA: hypothetical protein VMV59_10155 [Candidatus Dormibacteraeota bacterium]|nr:hypothetical protein [Candidatus Dormibacteraeota bacterium]
MKIKRAATTEIITPELVIAEAARGNLGKFLDKLVMQRVAEIFAKREEFILEPWFRTRRVAQEIRKLQTVQERNAKAIYFERHGCISCHTQDRPHSSSGMCTGCYNTIFSRLDAITRESSDLQEASRYSTLPSTAEHEKQPYVPRDLGDLASEECLKPPRQPRRALKGKE